MQQSCNNVTVLLQYYLSNKNQVDKNNDYATLYIVFQYLSYVPVKMNKFR